MTDLERRALLMEGRGWHKVAAEHGAKLRPDMQRGKVYLYQLYTTCFVEFDTLEQARAFRQYANESLEYWDYDPAATIDTNDPEDVHLWEKFMEEQAT